MKTYLIMIFTLSIFFSSELISQHHMGERRKNAREKIDQLEKVKLIETLNMSEEVSIRFFTKRNEFREKGRKLNQKIDSLSNFIREKMESSEEKTGDAEWNKIVDEFISTEKKMHNNKVEFLLAIQKILSPQQLAEFLAFERRFRDEVQDILLRGRKRPIPE